MNARRLFGLAALIIGLALCGKGLGMLFRPSVYEAVVKIEINPDYMPNEPMPYDPYFMETEFKRMEGGIVLSNVVQGLNLDVKWGKQEERQLGVGDTIEQLRQRMDIDAIQNTRLIDIGVWDRDPDEAAQIANAIAEDYSSYRIEQHKQQMKEGIQKLEEAYQVEETNIFIMQSNVGQLRKKFDTEPSDVSPAPSPLVNPEEMDEINRLLVNDEVDYAKREKQWIELQTMQATNSKALETSLKAQKSELDARRKMTEEARARFVAQQPYWLTKQKLDDAEKLHALLKEKIQEDKKYVIQPAAALVTIVEPAVPPKVPAVPNRWLGGLWLICGLALAGLGFCMLRSPKHGRDNREHIGTNPV